MIRKILTASIFLVCATSYGQKFDLQKEVGYSHYEVSKSKVETKLKLVEPGKFGEFVHGIKTRIGTEKKIVALTFDACGGPTGSGFDTLLIEFLKKEKIPSTLFISGAWIEKNDSLFHQLCVESLFEIENHGLLHRPCSVTSRSKYGIEATGSTSAAYDEIEINARQIALSTNKRPRFYRPAAAAADEACVTLANELGEEIISYDVLSGDAVLGTSAETIKKNILQKSRPGSIIIMHLNHPERNGFEALREVVPILKSQGYEFVKLEGHSLLGKK